MLIDSVIVLLELYNMAYNYRAIFDTSAERSEAHIKKRNERDASKSA